MVITWPLIAVCAVLAFTIGGGGAWVGFLIGYDRGQADHAAELDGQAPAPAPAYDPADPWRLGVRHVPPWAASAAWEPEPDTAPLRVILPRLGAPLRAAGRLVAGLGPGPNGDARRYATPEAAALAMQFDADQAEREIAELAQAAEARIGSVIERVRDELGHAPQEGTP